VFVTEDWNHDHLLGRGLAAALADPSPELKARFERCLAEGPREPPLTRLVIELMLANAESDEFVRAVGLDLRWARIDGGSGELDPSDFRVANLITNHFGLLPEE
jgi:hypothetical protein